jgi:hypothetical protein
VLSTMCRHHSTQEAFAIGSVSSLRNHEAVFACGIDRWSCDAFVTNPKRSFCRSTLTSRSLRLFFALNLHDIHVRRLSTFCLSRVPSCIFRFHARLFDLWPSIDDQLYCSLSKSENGVWCQRGWGCCLSQYIKLKHLSGY